MKEMDERTMEYCRHVGLAAFPSKGHLYRNVQRRRKCLKLSRCDHMNKRLSGQERMPEDDHPGVEATSARAGSTANM